MESNIKAQKIKLKQYLKEVNKIHGENLTISSEFHHAKKQMISMHREFKELDDDHSQKYSTMQCVICMNKIRSILYKPCGHILIYNECLAPSTKSYSKGIKRASNKGLSCQHCKEMVLSTKTVYL